MSDSPKQPPRKPSQTPAPPVAGPALGDEATVLSETNPQRTGTSRTHAVPPPPRPPTDESTVLNTRTRPPAADGEATVINTARTGSRPQSPPNEDTTTFSPTTGIPRDLTAGGTTQGPDYGASETAQLLAEGERIIKSRFVLEKLLGSGGMGSVYKARDLRKVEAHDRNPYVAIKVLNEDFQKHPDAFISLQREARKSQHLAHPNIVTVYDFDRDGDIVFMTMEYLEGEPLDKYLKTNKAKGILGASDKDALLLTRGMCAALARAHVQNIVHSDFKPGNVFVTTKGDAKVFDFGIARAVASSERHGQASEGDKTVFDAGDLGALTPAYASLEMLQGEEPDPRDDIYALAIVVYQLFTGKHPFDRLPANQAEQKKLKPEKPPRLTAQQWKAVRRGLAFKRAERTPSAEIFLQEFEHKAPIKVYMAAALVAILFATVIYSVIQGPQIVERERVVEKSTGVDLATARLDFQRERVDAVLKQTPWRGNWEEKLYVEYQGYAELVGKNDQGLGSLRKRIGGLYLTRITQLREADQLEAAELAIRNAETRYVIDPVLLANEKMLVASAVEAKKTADAQRAQEQQLAMAKMSETQRKAMEEKIAQEQAAQQQRMSELQRKSMPQADLQLQAQVQAVRSKLQCPNGDLNVRSVGVAVKNLQQIDAALVASLTPEFSRALAGCITQLGQRDPAAAEQTRQIALQIFPGNEALKSASVGSGDACPRSLAGLGGRGLRATCRDSLGTGGEGPRLVVIPGAAGVPVFALGKYELSVGEFNQYCRASGECAGAAGPANLPITGIGLAQAQGYLRWLSKESQRTYRLPTQQEWAMAARADGAEADPNRNCTLDSMGIRKGDAMVPIDTGIPNAWGLVNHVGNAQEWVLAEGVGSKAVLARGGARTDPIGECGVGSQKSHTGGADPVTGFRVLREMR